MKIGITADVHLREGEDESFERFEALKNILAELKEEDISTLVVAGDLFDKKCSNYNKFNEICRQNSGIEILAIPGNHDPELSSDYFSADNLEIIESPQIKKLEGVDFLFIPYDKEKAMGEVIASCAEELSDRWVLIGHGDYLSGKVPENPYEVGTYMPINENDLRRFSPELSILGHIHKRSNFEKIHYPGSPSGLHINETGPRYFSVLNLDKLTYEKKRIETEKVYQKEALLVLPLEDEKKYLEDELERMINNWNISKKNLERVTLKLEVVGYTKSLESVEEIIEDKLESVEFYEGSPDFSNLNILRKNERLELVKKVKEAVDEKADLIEEKKVEKRQVMEKALRKVLS